MGFNTGSELRKRQTHELGALLAVFNEALQRAEPFSTEWTDAAISVEGILRERTTRIAPPRLRF
jgi:hypothetical protein